MEGTTKYATFFLIFSVLFSYFSFAFSIATTDIETWDLTLDMDELYTSGILLGEATEHNVTFGNTTYTHFQALNNTEIRCTWEYSSIWGDRLLFSQHTTLFNQAVAWTPLRTRDHGAFIYNSTMVEEWNNNTKYSRFHFKNGYELFIMDPEQEHNITRAVYDDGVILCAVGETLTFNRDTNFLAFISWYTSIITGTSRYGLPPQFNIILQLLSVLSILSTVILVKEMLRL